MLYTFQNNVVVCFFVPGRLFESYQTVKTLMKRGKMLHHIWVFNVFQVPLKRTFRSSKGKCILSPLYISGFLYLELSLNCSAGALTTRALGVSIVLPRGRIELSFHS